MGDLRSDLRRRGLIVVVAALLATGLAPAMRRAVAEAARCEGAEMADPAATEEARCLLDAIEAGATGLLPIGQQVNMSSPEYARPIDRLDVLGDAPAVIGADVEELRLARQFYGDAGFDERIEWLRTQAQRGIHVTLSWHPRNPSTGGGSADRSVIDLAAVLDEGTAAGAAWKQDTAFAAAVAKEFQDEGLAVSFRPLHEANGPFFWWGRPDAAQYRALWTQILDRFAASGVHDVVWIYATTNRTYDQIVDPLSLQPTRYDVFGIDTYDPERGDPQDRVTVIDYDRIVGVGKPFAITEVGPFGSDGSWDPATVTDAVTASYPAASYATFWFTDGPVDGSEEYGGAKSIIDLDGHEDWWSACRVGRCPARGATPSTTAAPTTAAPTTAAPTTAPPTTAPATTVAPSRPESTPAQRFVRRLYRDLLGRAATAAEVRRDAPLASTEAGRSDLALRLAYGDERVGQVVDGLYRTILDRAAEPDGRRYWVGTIRQRQLVPASVAAELAASREFYERSGATDSSFVDAVYRTFLGRAPEPGGRVYWADVVRQHGRAAVTRPFYDSAESRLQRVDSLYRRLLGRSAESAGASYWAEVLLRNGDDLDLAVSIVRSSEYLQRATRGRM